MTSNRFIGRLIGKSVSELSFRSFYAGHISIGSIVMVDDDDTNRKYLLRVIDVSYGHESSEANWAEKVAGRMMEEDQKDRLYRIHDPERRLYKIVKCSPLGYIQNNKFNRPRSIPTHFSPVLLPDMETMEFLREYSGDLIVGYLRCGEDTMDISLGMDGSTLSQHVGIFATTGMGKSNLMKVLASAIMESKEYGLLIFDPHGEYFDGGREADRKGLKDHPLADSRFFTRTLRNLKGAQVDKLSIPFSEIEIEDITQIFGFSQAQYEALQAIRIKYGKEWLYKLCTKDLESLLEELQSSQLSFHESTMAVLIRRAKRLLEFRTVNKDKSYSTVGDILGKIQNGYTVLVDTANLSQDEETLVTSVITRAVLKSYKRKYQTEGDFEKLSPCLIMLEEAQRVLMASTGDTNIFHRIVREGRKFKVGLGVITQQPKLLSEELLSQLNSMFILGLADERDRNIVRSSSKQDISSLSTEIQTLAAGEALLTSPTVPFALPIKVFLYEDYLKAIKTNYKQTVEKPAEDFF
ncbi:MAG: ATP-binding protein [candidate division Zixibacteria bacterium]|nr:ATP-binding protein [candidate division Zixibacteria bacterium]